MNSSTIKAVYSHTTATGKHLYKVTFSEEDLEQKFVADLNLSGRTPMYLTYRDQKTLKLDDDGNKVVLLIGLAKPPSQMIKQSVPVTPEVVNGTIAYRVDTRLFAFFNQMIKEYTSASLDFCISEARAMYAQALAADAEESTSDDSIESTAPADDSAESDAEETASNTAEAVKDIVASATKGKKSSTKKS